MVTGICDSAMTVNVLGAPMSLPPKETPAKSDRRSNKPIMEKRRRARINNCLNELKTLILDATKKDPTRHSKLEKADILEKTVKHLQDLQRQQAVMQQAVDPKIINKFKAGFADCANEVSRFPGLEPTVKRRLLQHLQNCINGVRTELHHHQRQATATSMGVQQLTSQILPSPPSSPEQDHQHMQKPQQYIMSSQIQLTPHGYFLPNGMQVIPTRLSNGTIGLVLPQNLNRTQQPATAMPLNGAQHPNITVSIPLRTASTGSASSNSSYEQVYPTHSAMTHFAPPSPANSFEAMDYKTSVIQHAPSLQPLALVTKKQIKEEDQPWRPW